MANLSKKSKKSQRGIALMIALIVVFMFSAMAAAMMLSNRTDIMTLANYRAVTQARFTAEAGAQAAANWLMYIYPVQSSAGSLDITQSPVTTSGTETPVVIYSNPKLSSTYPDSTLVTSFQSRISSLNSGTAGGSLLSGANVDVSLTMISMQLVPHNLAGKPVYIQTWEIASTGNVQAINSVQVKVIERVGRNLIPVLGDGMFATYSGCTDVIDISGNFNTDSWNSTGNTTWPPLLSESGGNVGSNGNLTVGGSATVKGNYYSALAGTGACSAYTGKPGAVNQVVTGLPVMSYPTPTASKNPPNTPVVFDSGGTSCPSISGGSCTGPTTTTVKGKGNKTTTTTGYTLSTPTNDDASLGNITINSGTTVVFNPGTYDINSLVANNGTIVIPGGSNSVIFNVTCPDTTCTGNLPFDFTGNIQDSNGNPVEVTILYSGTRSLQTLNGNGSFYGVLYAPNAVLNAQFNGTFDWYGSILASKILFPKGTANVHYDVSLANKGYVASSWHTTSFTWNKY